MARRLRGVFGLLVLLALTVGLPWALAATIGNPLHQWSSIISGDLSDRDVIAIMAAVAYLAWASFAIAVLAELTATAVAAVSHGPRPTIRIPLLGPQQDLARALITSVLLLAPAVTAMVGPAAPAHGAPPAATAAAHPQAGGAIEASRTSTPEQARTGSYLIPERGGMRSYWAIADYYLGNARRWPEIWQLNQGRRQTDGSIMTSPNLLRPGWTVHVPAAAPGSPAALDQVNTPERVHLDVVHEGDTLSGLAAADGISEWHTVWPLNAGRAEPGGERFTDPNLIKPGWSVVMPDTAATPTPSRSLPAPAQQPPRRPPTEQLPKPGSNGTRPDPAQPPTSPAQSPTHAQPSAPAQSSVPGVTPPATVAPTVTATPAGTNNPAAVDPSHSVDMAVLAFTGGGLLLAGVSLAALADYRRRQFQRRRPGHTVSGSPPPLANMERAVLAAGSVGIGNVQWLDDALRSLVQAVAKQPGGRLPDVIAVRMTDAELTLVLMTSAPDPPTPWRPSEHATRWTISRDDPLPYDPARRDAYFAPFPTLASMGYSAAGEQWMLDLERISTLSLAGDEQRCLDLARFVAAELALNPWSEMLQVTLVGFGKELVAANPQRLSHAADLAGAATALARQYDAVQRALEAAHTDVLDGRLHDIIGDQWAPTVLLIAPQLAQDSAALDELLIKMTRQHVRAAVALVLAGDPERAAVTHWRLTVGPGGGLTIPALGLALTAHGIPTSEAAPLAQMLAYAAASDDRPVPAAHGDEPWDRYADACGSLTVRANSDQAAETSADRDADRTVRPLEPRRGPDEGSAVPVTLPVLSVSDSPPSANSVLPQSPQTYLDRSATTAEDLQRLAPPVDDQIRAEVEQSDPTLDTDVAAWHDDTCPQPKLRLLGRPQVHAKGQPPGQLAFHTEVVAFLATRLNGVPSNEYAQMMWPNDPNVVGKPKVRQSITVVRRWLGVDPRTGEDYLPSGLFEAGVARYRINKLLCDAELFRRLRLRGLSRGRDGIDDMWRALKLVDGPPFAEKDERRDNSPGGYLWLTEANHRLDFEYAAMIVDTAHTLATYHFGEGEPQRAAEAAQVALRSGAYDDVPLLDLVQACYAQDKDAEADGFVRQLLVNWGVERVEDLEPRTAEVLLRLRRRSRQRAS